MSIFKMKLPDVGEGVAEAEIVDWLVDVGDDVTPDTVLAEVLTDKATVEISPPVTGIVVARYGEAGDVLAVGSNLIDIETVDGVASGQSDSEPKASARSDSEPTASAKPDSEPKASAKSDSEPKAPAESDSEPKAPASEPTPPSGALEPPATSEATRPPRVTSAPAVRRRAQELGIDLSAVSGSGPGGRVVHADLDRLLVGDSSPAPRRAGPVADEPKVEQVRGVRRRIAERLTATWSEVPHITYVEAVDVTELEALRAGINASDDGRTRLTMLPFFVRAIVVACRDQPEINAHYDHESGTLTIHGAVHVGIATQTDRGLLVPVLRHAESLELHEAATEIARITEAARDLSASREQLSGSTITITSLGAIGGLVTTPILNAPEVAIVGVNKIEMRPVWRDGAFQPRKVVNLSSSFDHRMVDGWDAARFVQRLKSLLETPALLFID